MTSTFPLKGIRFEQPSKRSPQDYLLAYFIIGISGIAFFQQLWFLISFGLFVSFIFYRKRLKFDKAVLLLVLIVSVIAFVQSLYFGGNILYLLKFVVFSIIMPYMLLKIIGYQFPFYLVDIIFVYSIISLVFWSLSNLSPDFYAFTKTVPEMFGDLLSNPEIIKLSGGTEQFILYTYENARTSDIVRNPGPFYEPGAFASFLVFGIIFNTLISKRFLNYKNVVMIIALVTTFSTSGVVGLLIFLSFIPFNLKNLFFVFKFFILLGVLGLSYYTYTNTEFLAQKIETQYTDAQQRDLNQVTSGRFYAATKSVYVLEKYPIFGRGLLSQTKADVDSAEATEYGFLSFFANIGIPLSILYILFFVRALKFYTGRYNMPPSFTVFTVLCLFSILFAQALISSLMFLMLFMVSIVFYKK